MECDLWNGTLRKLGLKAANIYFDKWMMNNEKKLILLRFWVMNELFINRNLTINFL